MNVIKNITAKTSIKCPHTMVPEGITVHNTANDASAKSEIAYMNSNDSQTSFHYAVDDIEAVQGVEENRNTWNAGDGANGFGNRKTISIEICYSKSGGDRFIKAEQNAVHLIVDILKRYGWGIEKVGTHQMRSGKYCPHRTLDMGWQRFLDMIVAELNPPKAYEQYSVVANVPVYMSSIDAMNRNHAVTYFGIGNYFVGDKANGMLNISLNAGNKDGWINPGDNVVKVVPIIETPQEPIKMPVDEQTQKDEQTSVLNGNIEQAPQKEPIEPLNDTLLNKINWISLLKKIIDALKQIIKGGN